MRRICILLIFLFCAGADRVVSQSCEEPPASATAYELRPTSDVRRDFSTLGSQERRVLQKINRRDQEHLFRAAEILVPLAHLGDPGAHSPFPLCLPQLETIEKTVLVSLRLQAFGAYERGELVRWGPTSTGSKEQQTPASLYSTNWRSRLRRSTINYNWLLPWYFNLHTSMGVAFHQYDLPGRPASYGCIRLLEDDARWLYEWAEEWVPSSTRNPPEEYGTPVVVFGSYAYDRPGPWDGLARRDVEAVVDRELLRETLSRYLWVIQKREEEKGSSSSLTGTIRTGR